MTATARLAPEFTPSSMKPRQFRGRTERRVFNPQTKRYERLDADVHALRRIAFGHQQSPFDLRADMRESLGQARAALGLV